MLQIEFLEWPVTFLSKRSKDDRDQRVGVPSTKVHSEGPGLKSWKKIQSSRFQSEFGLIKGLPYSSKSQNFHGIILLQKRSSWFWKGKFNQNVTTDCLVKMFSANLDCT